MRTFHGGIHPNDHKFGTADKPIIDLAPPEELVFPLSQHIGAPSIPCVSVGDTVLVGQKIADANGFVSANLHSSVSGTVTAIEKRLVPNGTISDCIIIKNDGENRRAEPISGYAHDYTKLSPKQIIDIVKDAGIVGMGGAAFPTHVKLSVPDGANIDHVIINGSECEPYLTSDHRAMLETTKYIIGGLKIIMHIFGLKDGYIGIEDNKPNAIEKMRNAAESEKAVNIHVVPLKTKYPQGAEKQLIYAICKRKLKPGTLPWQSGCIVNNIDTCASIFRAVTYGRPLCHRIVTVGGGAIKEEANYRVAIGTPFEYIAQKSGGFTQEVKKIIMGGPMMGKAVSSVDVPVIKGTSGILFLGDDEAYSMQETACIRCSKCVYVCPMNLQPNLLDSAARFKDYDKLKKLNITDCIECGSCAYVCPSKRHQVQQIHTAKAIIREKSKK